MPGPADFQRMEPGVIPDAVVVAFSTRVIAGVKTFASAGHGLHAQDANLWREVGVERCEPRRGCVFIGGHVGMRYLTECMHSRIGAPGTMHADAGTDNLGK